MPPPPSLSPPSDDPPRHLEAHRRHRRHPTARVTSAKHVLSRSGDVHQPRSTMAYGAPRRGKARRSNPGWGARVLRLEVGGLLGLGGLGWSRRTTAADVRASDGAIGATRDPAAALKDADYLVWPVILGLSCSSLVVGTLSALLRSLANYDGPGAPLSGRIVRRVSRRVASRRLPRRGCRWRRGRGRRHTSVRGGSGAAPCPRGSLRRCRARSATAR